jgi:hypothetical protein
MSAQGSLEEDLQVIDELDHEGEGEGSSGEEDGEMSDMMSSDENPIFEEIGAVIGRIFFTLMSSEDGSTLHSVLRDIHGSIDQHNAIMEKQNKILYKLTQIIESKV